MLDFVFDQIPTFDDPYADVQRRYHLSGAQVADILYQATDKEGNPTYPKNNADGHGRLIVVELDSKFKALAWKHSRAEGGATEAGSDFEKPLAFLDEAVNNKRDVIKKARELMSARFYDTAAAADILGGFDQIVDYKTPKEQELREQYERLVERNDKNKSYFSRTAENEQRKKDLLEKARSLKGSEEWNQSADIFKELLDEWKKTGNAGADNDKMWEEFTEIRNDFFDRRSAHFKELDSTRRNARQIKRDIIKEARRVAIESPDYNATHRKLEKLFADWKKAGHAGKDENSLWDEFKSVRDEFYNRREEAYRDRLQEKEALADEAEALSAGEDYGSFVSDRMRELNEEWKKTGYCGKEGDAAWERFHAAQNKFWQSKKEINAARMTDRKEKLEEAVERRQEKIKKIEENNLKLKERLSTTADEEKKSQIEGWIRENDEKIAEIQSEIDSMEKNEKR